MRIPSQFNDETLYGRRGRQPSSGGAYRRVIRLAVVLALVVVVMQQASQPEMYETFFGSGEIEEVVLLPSESSPGAGEAIGITKGNVNHENVSNGQKGRAEAIQVDPATITEETRAAAVAITLAMQPMEQRQWTVILDRWQSGEEFDLVRSVIPATATTIQRTEGLSGEEQQAWTATLETFGQRFGNAEMIVAAPQKQTDGASASRENANADDAKSESGASLSVPAANEPADDELADDELAGDDLAGDDLAGEDIRRLVAWLGALDQAAVDRVVDGAIWLSSDFDAFYRQLDQVHKLDPRGAVSVSVVPLMQQPQVYLGQRVRVSGRVARAERKEAAANPFGVQEYWELWIRPSDGGDRPMVLIVPNVTQVIKDVGAEAALSKGPEVRVIGRFFKRLAYGSSIGADAAPVVVGRILGRQPSAVAVTTAQPSADGMPIQTRFLLTLAAAIVFGVALAAFVMWRTAVLSKRSRTVRGSNRPSPEKLFDKLAEHDPSANPIVKK